MTQWVLYQRQKEQVGMAQTELETMKQQYAEVGAGVRLRELEKERQTILEMFPALNGNGNEGVHPPTVTANPDVVAPYPTTVEAVTRKKRKPMSKAQRLAVSKRMSAYWREKRKAART